MNQQHNRPTQHARADTWADKQIARAERRSHRTCGFFNHMLMYLAGTVFGWGIIGNIVPTSTLKDLFDGKERQTETKETASFGRPDSRLIPARPSIASMIPGPERNEELYAAFVTKLKRFENDPLRKKKHTDKRRFDKLGKVYEIGYGFTDNGVADAIGEGFLEEGYKLPTTMTEAAADKFLRNVVIPTYRQIVNRHVTVPLSYAQECALVSFTYNLGKTNLCNLIEGEGRLNSGDYANVESKIILYVNTKTRKKVEGLIIRRNFEKNLWATSNID